MEFNFPRMGLTACRPRTQHFRLHYLLQNHQGDQQRGGELWLIYYDLDFDTGIHSDLKIKTPSGNCMIKAKTYFVSMWFGICMIYFQKDLNSFLGVFDHKYIAKHCENLQKLLALKVKILKKSQITCKMF